MRTTRFDAACGPRREPACAALVAVLRALPAPAPATRSRPRFGAPARAASSSTASSIVNASGVVPFGSDALVVPSVTYGP